MIQKTVNAEVKADLKSSTIVWDLDAHYLRGYHPSYISFLKIQTQNSSIKKSKAKKLKPKKPKPALSRDHIAKLIKKKDRKNQKKSLRDISKSRINKV